MSPVSVLSIVLALILIGPMLYRVHSKNRSAQRKGWTPTTRRDARSPAAQMERSDAPTGITLEDREVLLGAIKARLRHSLSEGSAHASEPTPEAVGQLRSIVRECADALDRLHATLENEQLPPAERDAHFRRPATPGEPTPWCASRSS